MTLVAKTLDLMMNINPIKLIESDPKWTMPVPRVAAKAAYIQAKAATPSKNLMVAINENQLPSLD